MPPDYHSMIIAALVFIVLPLLLVGIPALVVRARARGRRLFRDEPNKRIDNLRPMLVADHREDAL